MPRILANEIPALEPLFNAMDKLAKGSAFSSEDEKKKFEDNRDYVNRSINLYGNYPESEREDKLVKTFLALNEMYKSLDHLTIPEGNKALEDAKEEMMKRMQEVRSAMLKRINQTEQERAQMDVMHYAGIQASGTFNKKEAQEYLQGPHILRTPHGNTMTISKDNIKLTGGILSEDAQEDFVKMCMAKFDKTKPITLEALSDPSMASSLQRFAKGGLIALYKDQRAMDLAIKLAENGYSVSESNLNAMNDHKRRLYEQAQKKYKSEHPKIEAETKALKEGIGKAGVEVGQVDEKGKQALITGAETKPEPDDDKKSTPGLK